MSMNTAIQVRNNSGRILAVTDRSGRLRRQFLKQSQHQPESAIQFLNERSGVCCRGIVGASSLCNLQIHLFSWLFQKPAVMSIPNS